jgi:uncharacterized membrane protein YeaQ/YmgE (transglycosylase-associated protein family)
MSIVGTIIIGFFVGLVARFIKPDEDKMGLLFTTLVGIVGAFVGRFLGQAIGVYRADEPSGFVGAVLGAVIVLTLLKVTNNRRITH